ncbi:MAG TPA: sialidase family protein [Candidatus Acidoferrum sp.]|nr:sialidase family protein [Candidatus Acidoferrum sp.]
MKHDSLNLTLGLLLAFAAMLAGGCNRANKTVDETFEAQPRPVLESIGISASWDPRLAVDTAGGLHLFAVYNQDFKSRLGLVISENGGDTLTPPIVPISEAGVSIGSHGEQSPGAAMTRSGIYALWQEQGTDGLLKIMSARSLTWGESFDKPVQVSDKGAHAYRGFPSIGVAPNGDIYAVWLDERDVTNPGQDTSSVYLARSTDQGATFGQNVRVGEQTCPCCRPTLAFGANGEVFVAWRRVFAGEIRNMVVSTSRDGGSTFAEPVTVHDDGWKINGCPDSGPSLAESNGSLWIAWTTAGKDDRARIYVSNSEDSAHSFKNPVKISGGVLDPNHPAIKAGSDGTLWVVFQGRAPSADGNWSKTQAYIVHIDKNGDPSQPAPIPGSNNSISYPRIALGNGGQIFVAWTQPQGDHFIVMLTRGREKG